MFVTDLKLKSNKGEVGRREEWRQFQCLIRGGITSEMRGESDTQEKLKTDRYPKLTNC